MVIGSGPRENRIPLHTSQAIMPCIGQFCIGNLHSIGQEEGGIEMQIDFNGTIAAMNSREGIDQDGIGVIILTLIPDSSPDSPTGIKVLMNGIFWRRPNGEPQSKNRIYLAMPCTPHCINIRTTTPYQSVAPKDSISFTNR